MLFNIDGDGIFFTELTQEIKQLLLVINDRDSFEEDFLRISLQDGTTLAVFDAQRSCCESRYIECDDTLKEFEGSIFKGIEHRKLAVEEPNVYADTHEIDFVLIHTSNGVITLRTHNEHNGYYGGFCLRVEKETPAEKSKKYKFAGRHNPIPYSPTGFAFD